ncbi:MAG: TetR/AcrR family transcriptional regulator [Trueperaceae bacterium]
MTTVTRATRLKEASKKRRDQQKADLRQGILEAAVKLFEEKGYEGFSLRQVAEEIGYTPTTIYLYFKDKDALLLNVVYDGFKEFGETLEKGYQSGRDPLERLQKVGWAYFDFAMSHPVHYRLMFMQRGDFMQAHPEGYERVIDSFGVLERVIREGIEANIMRKGEVRTYAALIWANVHGLVSLALIDQRTFSLETTKHLFALQMDAIKRAYCV